jgi:hypothetical protein
MARRVAPASVLAFAVTLAIAPRADGHASWVHRQGAPDSVPVSVGDPSAAPTAHVQYFGGHVVSRAEIVVVLWGAVDGSIAAAVGPFYETITSSGLFDWLGEYDTAGADVAPAGQGAGTRQRIHRPTYLKTVAIAPAAGSGNLLDSDIQTELANDVATGALPPPHADPEGGVDTIYMVYFPPGTSIVGPGAAGISCSQFCAYHDTFSATFAAATAIAASLRRRRPTRNAESRFVHEP